MSVKTIKTFLFITSLIFSPTLYADTFKIGAIFALTGDVAYATEAMKEGAVLAQTQLNKKGGIDNKQIELIFEDSQFLPRIAKTAGTKLINQNKINASLVSTINEIRVVGSDLEKAKIPSIVIWDSAPEIDAIGDFIFSIGPWAPSTSSVSAEFIAKQLSSKKVAMITSEDSWPQLIRGMFKEDIKKYSTKLIFDESVGPEETDFRSLITKIKAPGADTLYCPMTGLIPLFQQIKLLAPNIRIVTSDNITPALIAENPKAFEDVYQSMILDPENKSLNKLKIDYKNLYSRDMSQSLLVAWGYDGIMLINEAQKIANTKKISLKDAMYKVQKYPGASGLISFNAAGTSPMLEKMAQVKGSKIIHLK